MGCWYLTALGCWMSFGLDLRKRKLDFITADFVATLAFPTIAAAHLISQVRAFPKYQPDLPDDTMVQYAASIEASLMAIDAYLALGSSLFILAAVFQCSTRGCLLAAVGVFCISAECYMNNSRSVRQTVKYSFERTHFVDYARFLTSVVGVGLLCLILALSLLILFRVMRPTAVQARTSDRETGPTQSDIDRSPREDHYSSWSTLFSLWLLPGSLISWLIPLSLGGEFTNLPSQFLPLVRSAAARISSELVPGSNTYIKELDQAAAIFAGAAVFGFSLYSTADSHYRAWLSRTAQQQRDIELTACDRLRSSHSEQAT